MNLSQKTSPTQMIKDQAGQGIIRKECRHIKWRNHLDESPLKSIMVDNLITSLILVNLKLGHTRPQNSQILSLITVSHLTLALRSQSPISHDLRNLQQITLNLDPLTINSFSADLKMLGDRWDLPTDTRIKKNQNTRRSLIANNQVWAPIVVRKKHILTS